MVIDLNKSISENRIIAMGIALVCILFTHQWFLEGPFFDVMHNYGHWGVDIFMFISGFGIAHSLNKNTLPQYFANRFYRLFPSCILVGLATTAFAFFFHYAVKEPLPEFKILCFMPFALEHWYIFASVICYIFAPLWKKGINRYGLKYCIFLLLLSLVFIAIEGKYSMNAIWPLNWTIYRIPTFALGMWFCMKKEVIITNRHLYTCFGYLMLIIFLIRYNVISGDYCYAAILPLMPFCCLASGYINKGLKVIKLSKAIQWLGIYSLEIYLIHEELYGRLLDLFNSCFVFIPRWIQFALAIVLALIAAYLLHIVAGILQTRIKALSQNRTNSLTNKAPNK